MIAKQDKTNLELSLDLSNSNLSNAEFDDAHFFGTNFMDTNLSYARFSCIINADTDGCFEKVDLGGANFVGASLQGGLIFGADLSIANLMNANFKSTHIRDVNFNGADFRGTDLDGATLIDTNLRDAKSLTDKQLEFSVLCKVQLPKVSKLNPNRDCKELGIDPYKKTPRELILRVNSK